ncbi:DUF2795 domain-containing protein [Aquipuribacter sp. SD81]|uniref:DUF2795 domain-containing protein n=1 Tax=Aquipuribacter sp. SD81 TaxID=3127703 RepID=UPI003018EE37
MSTASGADRPTSTDVGTRSEIAQALGKEVYPADRDRLVAVATGHDASDRVLDLLRGLPEGRVFDNVQEVAVAAGVASSDPEGAGAD